MATYESAKAVNLTAGEDLRGDVFKLVYIENDAGVGKVIKTTAVTQTPVGIIGEEPRTDQTTDGDTVPVVILQGVCKGMAGAAITAGDLLVPDITAGLLAGVANSGAIAADSMAIGVALTSAADGDVFSFLAMPIAAPHTA